jgi:hypothetical protein
MQYSMLPAPAFFLTFSAREAAKAWTLTPEKLAATTQQFEKLPPLASDEVRWPGVGAAFLVAVSALPSATLFPTPSIGVCDFFPSQGAALKRQLGRLVAMCLAARFPNRSYAPGVHGLLLAAVRVRAAPTESALVVVVWRFMCTCTMLIPCPPG